MRTHRLAAGCCAALVFLVAGAASALPAGTLAITDHAMDPASGSLDKDLKKEMKSTLKKTGETWHLYFVAFLNKEAGAPELNIVFYDVTNKKREQVNAYPIQTQPKAKIVMSDIEISADQSFKPAHKYQVLITRLIGGKEVVYAKAMLTLE